jgi:hypothetical protein
MKKTLALAAIAALAVVGVATPASAAPGGGKGKPDKETTEKVAPGQAKKNQTPEPEPAPESRTSWSVDECVLVDVEGATIKMSNYAGVYTQRYERQDDGSKAFSDLLDVLVDAYPNTNLTFECPDSDGSTVQASPQPHYDNGYWQSRVQFSSTPDLVNVPAPNGVTYENATYLALGHLQWVAGGTAFQLNGPTYHQEVSCWSHFHGWYEVTHCDPVNPPAWREAVWYPSETVSTLQPLSAFTDVVGVEPIEQALANQGVTLVR